MAQKGQFLQQWWKALLFSIAIVITASSISVVSMIEILNSRETGSAGRVVGDKSSMLRTTSLPLNTDESGNKSEEDDDDNTTCTPKGIHLAPRTDVDEDDGMLSMTVSFFLPLLPCQETRPVVYYGRRGHKSSNKAQAPEPNLLHYASRKTDGEVETSDWVYHVELSGLYGGQQEYWYRIELEESTPRREELKSEVAPRSSSSSPLSSSLHKRSSIMKFFRRRFSRRASPTQYFRTPPLPNTPTSIAIVADLGDTSISMRNIEAMKEAAAFHLPNSDMATNIPVSHVIVAGDISYADGHIRYWSQWLEHTESLFQQIPLAVSVGNHEIECDINTLRVFDNYELWFRMPNRIREAHRLAITPEYKETLSSSHCISPVKFLSEYNYGNSFYAYRHGSIHVVVVNPYTSCRKNSVQYEWLRTELKHHVDRELTPWVLAVVHVPLYTTFHHSRRVEDADDMEHLFYKYGVNLVVSGHDHGYMRSRGGIAPGGIVTKEAPTYFIVGTGGSDEGPAKGGYWHEEHIEKFVSARSLWAAGFGELTVYNATHAEWAFHSVETEDWYYRHLRSDITSVSYSDRALLRNPYV